MLQALNPKDSVVLVVEDNPDDTMIVANALDRFGVKHVHTAETAEDAMALLRTKRCDVILTDYNLPGKNGLRLLEDIQASHPEIPVIVVTGARDEAVAVAAMKQGASDYITKDELLTSGIVRSLQAAIRGLETSHNERLRPSVGPNVDAIAAARQEAAWLQESGFGRASARFREADLPGDAQAPVDVLADDSFLRSGQEGAHDPGEYLDLLSTFLQQSFRAFPGIAEKQEDALIRVLVEQRLSPDEIIMMYKATLVSFAASGETAPMSPLLYLTHLLFKLVDEYQRSISINALDQAA